MEIFYLRKWASRSKQIRFKGTVHKTKLKSCRPFVKKRDSTPTNVTSLSCRSISFSAEHRRIFPKKVDNQTPSPSTDWHCIFFCPYNGTRNSSVPNTPQNIFSRVLQKVRFEKTWGWVNYDRFFILGWTVPLMSMTPNVSISCNYILKAKFQYVQIWQFSAYNSLNLSLFFPQCYHMASEDLEYSISVISNYFYGNFLSLYRNEQCDYFAKNLLFFKQPFEMTQGWENSDRSIIFWVNYPYKDHLVQCIKFYQFTFRS